MEKAENYKENSPITLPYLAFFVFLNKIGFGGKWWLGNDCLPNPSWNIRYEHGFASAEKHILLNQGWVSETTGMVLIQQVKAQLTLKGFLPLGIYKQSSSKKQLPFIASNCSVQQCN